MKNMEIKSLVLLPRNPRTIDDDKFGALQDSLKDFPEMMNARPIVINQQNAVLGGNMRVRAAISLGIKELPVIKVDWSEEKQKQFIIKDNTSFGTWDWDILANEWDEVELKEWGLEVWQPEEEIDKEEAKEERITCELCGK